MEYQDIEVIASVQKVPFRRSVVARLVKKTLAFFAGVTFTRIVRIAEDFTSGESELEETYELANVLIEAKIIRHIRRTRTHADEPQGYFYSSSGGGGFDFFDKKKALMAAIAEGLERHVWRDHTDYLVDTRTSAISDMCNMPQLYPARPAGHSPTSP